MRIPGQLRLLAAKDRSFLPMVKRTNSFHSALSSLVSLAGSIFVDRQFDRVGTNGRIFGSLAAGTIRSGAMAHQSSTLGRPPGVRPEKVLTDQAASPADPNPAQCLPGKLEFGIRFGSSPESVIPVPRSPPLRDLPTRSAMRARHPRMQRVESGEKASFVRRTCVCRPS